MNAIDTNIWIYAHDRRDQDKQQKAQALIASLDPIALPWRVGCEFIAATRKLQPFGLTVTEAWEALDDMRSMSAKVLVPEPELWDLARDLQQRVQLSLWDGLLVAACVRGGVRTLYTEDLGGAAAIDGVIIINPLV